ncbi:hypothetical protein ED28_13815 [[Pantoea] beijingensis]|uniref:YhdP central domain-containing protein n=1 Tax=[Pantoea] beijingensis TaxID=1324864 RepID=A0A443IBT1_9GAMM|nr:AsmA2 domain-containing protein YhdP [[Pantoea] beijingensis]RWR01559.1 hypothetical protein ED28_13815 [[Pantoea] beijingensis]
MRQLPRILLLAGAVLIVVVALLVSGLRLVMPHMDSYRSSLLNMLSSASGLPVDASKLHGRWESFGPSLEVNDVKVGLNDGGKLTINRITLALDVWQSLLHARWQFRDLTFYQLNLTTNTPLINNDSKNNNFKFDNINNLFLRQFDHFNLRDSTISFLTPSGQRAELSIPALTWLNEKTRHRAEGEVSLSSITGQHGVVQIRLDLRDEGGLLNNGRIWMQADDVDVKPWLGQWMHDNTSLESARFSLAAWLTLQEGEIYDGDILLKQGGARWLGDAVSHRLDVDNVTAHIARFNGGWTLLVPQTNLKTDGAAWPKGQFSLLWQPEKGALPGPDTNEELRIRATQLDLQHLDPLIPLFAKLSTQLLENWRALEPHGLIQTLALDVPMKQPEQTRFQAKWQGVSWKHWKLLPAMENFDGSLSGGISNGRLALNVSDAVLPYGDIFRAPLEIEQATGELDWEHSPHALVLSGKNLSVKARSLWTKGDFSYSQNEGQEPRLDILAGINVTDAADAWRYFPEPLMGKALTRYLGNAIKGGEVKNASLIFAGNPKLFPFKHNEGMFEVWVPLRKSTYEFEPGWPLLNDLDIDLDFVNDGLWMNAPEAMLGNVQGQNISAVIPDYLKERLIIDGDIRGAGPDVRAYFNQSPLKPTLGAALDELQVGGDVSGRLHLNIPLDGQQVRATGEVVLQDNSLLIKPLDSTLENLTGRFDYDNGNLRSSDISASWFGQPLGINFTTQESDKDYQIGVNLKGDWQLAKLDKVPPQIATKIAGSAPWKGNVAISLPHGGGANYNVTLDGDLKNISSHLPSPLDKASGKAMPVNILAAGNLAAFELSGAISNSQRFNSRWLLGDTLRIDRGIWLNNSKTKPKLPDSADMVLNLPPLDGEAWLGLMKSAGGTSMGDGFIPGNITLRTPELNLAGQHWHDLNASIRAIAGGTQILAKGREVNGSLDMISGAPWRAHLNYLYYNPQFDGNGQGSSLAADSASINFSHWPALRLGCDECWIHGQKFGRIAADLTPKNDTLMLENGVIDTGNARLTASGEWVNRSGEQRSSIKGQLSGKKINETTNWFGVSSPLRDAPFSVDYDLHWRSAPWQPSVSSLSGVLKSHLGKGEIIDVNTGRAGQLLRLVSIDALMRKLRLDFSDTFGEGFYFDSINGTSWIKDGIMRTDNLLVDGLEADIAMRGKVDLVQRKIDMEAVVAPEISTTVGVAAAFVVNPVVGAAVFAASKVLAPLWNKISVLRYQISGPLDKPEINEVLRKPREKSAK